MCVAQGRTSSYAAEAASTAISSFISPVICSSIGPFESNNRSHLTTVSG